MSGKRQAKVCRCDQTVPSRNRTFYRQCRRKGAFQVTFGIGARPYRWLCAQHFHAKKADA